MSSRSLVGIANRIPAQILIVTSALIQYSGAAVAVFAFSVVEPASVAWWRGFVGGLVLCAWVRPWRGLDRATLKGALFFGIALVCMNACFYEAISRIPLGAAVSLEFLGPVMVARCTRPWLGTASCCIFCALWRLCHRWAGPGFERSANASGIGLGYGGCGLVGGIYRPWTKGCIIKLRDDQPLAGLCV